MIIGHLFLPKQDPFSARPGSGNRSKACDMCMLLRQDILLFDFYLLCTGHCSFLVPWIKANLFAVRRVRFILLLGSPRYWQTAARCPVASRSASRIG